MHEGSSARTLMQQLNVVHETSVDNKKNIKVTCNSNVTLVTFLSQVKPIQNFFHH